jgi:hypothetical protein
MAAGSAALLADVMSAVSPDLDPKLYGLARAPVPDPIRYPGVRGCHLVSRSCGVSRSDAFVASI